MTHRLSKTGTNIAALVAVIGCARAPFPEFSRPLAADEDRQDAAWRYALSLPAQAALADAEHQLQSGHAAAALGPLERARELAPDSALVERTRCQALLGVGRRAEALAACHVAMRLRGTGHDARVLVRAVLSGPELVNGAQLSLAHALAERAVEGEPSSPWGHAARCDLAERLGDAAMIHRCASDLARVAPGHPETERAALLVARAARPVWRISAGLALLAALGATLLHAILSRLRPRSAAGGAALQAGAPPRRRLGANCAAAWGLGVAIGLGGVTAARAEEAPTPPAVEESGATYNGSEVDPVGATWPVNPDDPEGSIPTEAQRAQAPLKFAYFVLELSDLADAALKAQDYPKAVKLFQAVRKIASERAAVHAQLCAALEGVGDIEGAIAECREALDREGVQVKDFARYVRLILAHRPEVDPATLADLEAVLAHLREQEASAVIVAQLDCELGMHLQSLNRLRSCTQTLAELTPGDPQLLLYQWHLAMQEERWDDARGLVAQARKTDLDPALLQDMDRTMASVARRRWVRVGAFSVGGLTVSSLLAYLLFLFKRRRGVGRGRSVVDAAASPVQGG